MSSLKRQEESDGGFPKDSFFSPAKKSGKHLRSMLRWLSILILLGSVAAAWHFQKKYSELLEKQVNSQDELSGILSKISSLMDLPSDEIPTLATITDTARLSGQVFFERAENGDKVIVYTKAAKAILFRPTTGRVINVSSVVDDTASQSAVEKSAAVTESSSSVDVPLTTSPLAAESGSMTSSNSSDSVVTQKIRIALYNGTNKAGMTTRIEKEFFSDVTSVEVILKENAIRNDYTTTLVIDSSGNQEVLAGQLAKKLGGTLASMPQGEPIPDADILIIVGRDQI